VAIAAVLSPWSNWSRPFLNSASVSALSLPRAGCAEAASGTATPAIASAKTTAPRPILLRLALILAAFEHAVEARLRDAQGLRRARDGSAGAFDRAGE